MGSIHGLEKHDAERTAVYRKVAMEKTIVQNYDELYALQDRVLGLVFSEETPFYLTGGTALHRIKKLILKICFFHFFNHILAAICRFF